MNTKTINVLLVGRSGTGKSSIVSSLIDPQSSVLTKGFSSTKEPIFQPLVVTDKKSQTEYQINIFDTPGLEEMRLDGSKRSNVQLIHLIKLCIKHEVTFLNLIALVTPAGQTNLLDVHSFEFILESLGSGFSKVCAILLTKCDEFEDAKLEQFVRTIETTDNTKKTIKFCQQGIIKFCAINIESIEGKATNDEMLKEMLIAKLKRVEKMRNEFISKIIKCASNAVELTAVKNFQNSQEVERELNLAVDQLKNNIEQRLQKLVLSSTTGSKIATRPPTTESSPSEQHRTFKHLLSNEEKHLGIGNFEIQTAKRINVLLVGRSSVGKSTLVNTILDPHISISTTGLSATKHCQLYTFVVRNINTNLVYHLNIVDTPGLGEVMKDSKASRDTEALLNLSRLFLSKFIVSLNVVGFVSKYGETALVDIQHFNSIIQFLGQAISPRSMLILTHADKYRDDKLKELENNLKSNNESAGLLQFCKLGCKRYGAVSIDELKSYQTEGGKSLLQKLVIETLNRTEKMRSDIIDTFIKCEDSFEIEAFAKISEKLGNLSENSVPQNLTEPE